MKKVTLECEVEAFHHPRRGVGSPAGRMEGGGKMKKIIAVLLAALFLLCACGAKKETKERFVIEYSEPSSAGSSIAVIRDTESGAAYLFVRSGYAGGLTRLEEDADGAD